MNVLYSLQHLGYTIPRRPTPVGSAMLRRAGHVPDFGNHHSECDAGYRPDFENPEYR